MWYIIGRLIFIDINFLTGDLFENELDISDASRWKASSENHDVQMRSRWKVIDLADYIIPGHRPMFRATDKHKMLLKPTSAVVFNA